MTKAVTSPHGAMRAHAYAAGQSRTFKAEPTELNVLAAKVMCASGAFSTQRKVAEFRPVRIFGAITLLLAAGTFAIASDAPPIDENMRVASQRLAPDELFTLGVGHYIDIPVTVADTSETLDAQDRFEIARLSGEPPPHVRRP